MRRAVVTGGAGFIGSHLCDALRAEGFAVRVLDNLSTGNLDNIAQFRNDSHFELVELDIAHDPITPHLREVDHVYHLAALADIVPSIERPLDYRRANVDGTFAVLEAARAANVRRFVYAASSSCYGIPERYPTAESAPCRPEYPYALTKYLGEQAVMHWHRVYGLPALSLRLFNVYGPRSRTKGAYGAMFGIFLAQKLAGKPLTVVGDGTQTRDFTYVSDIASAFVTAGASECQGEIFNVGTGHPVSVNHIVNLLGAERIEIPKRPGEPDCTHADTRKIHERLGWLAQVDIDAGVSKLLEHLEYWRKAPVWSPNDISQATAAWFRHLGNRDDAKSA